MYIHFEVNELEILYAALDWQSRPTAQNLKEKIRKKLDEIQDLEKQKIRDAYTTAAFNQHHKEGVCEVDENATVSTGEDPGAYVMAWVWVDAIDAGICITCGEPDADNGEGFDGECGSCSDKSFLAEEGDDIDDQDQDTRL